MADTLFSKKYTIHHVLKSNQYMNIFVAQTKEESPQKVLLNQWTDKKLIQKWLGTLLDMKQKNLSDFLDCFAEDGKIYTVFCYKDGKNLLQYVQTERLALTYRVVLLQNILEEFLKYQHYDKVLQYCMLQYPNIVIQNHAISFNYQLLLLPEQNELDCFAALEQTMKVLFTNEELKSMPKLLIVFQKCQKGLYQYFGEVIKDLQDVTGAVQKQKNIKEYIEEKKKNNRKKLIKGIVLFAIVGMIYMAYDYYNKNIDNTFLYAELEQLGSVDIITQPKTHQQQTDIVVEVKEKKQEKELSDITTQENVQTNTSQFELIKTYIVQSGNNLTQICLQNYHDIAYLQSFADYNHIKNINMIYPNQVLKLPPKEQLQKIPIRQNTIKQKTTTPKVTLQNTILPEQNNEDETEMEEYILLLEEEDYD